MSKKRWCCNSLALGFFSSSKALSLLSRQKARFVRKLVLNNNLGSISRPSVIELVIKRSSAMNKNALVTWMMQIRSQCYEKYKTLKLQNCNYRYKCDNTDFSTICLLILQCFETQFFCINICLYLEYHRKHSQTFFQLL